MARRTERYLVIRRNGEHRSIHDTREAAEAAAQREREADAKAIADGWCKGSWGYSVIPWYGKDW